MRILQYANTIWIESLLSYKKGEEKPTHLHALRSTWILATEYFDFLGAEEVRYNSENTISIKVSILNSPAYKVLCSKNVDFKILPIMDWETNTPKLEIVISLNQDKEE